MINERLSELGSAILEVKEDKFHVTGFMYPERLEDYYYRKVDCYFSKGIYPVTELDFSLLNDDALILLIDENGNEKRVQFKVLKKDTVIYKVADKKQQLAKVYSVRRCNYTGMYNLKFTDGSLLFNSKEELQEEFSKRFNKNLEF